MRTFGAALIGVLLLTGVVVAEGGYTITAKADRFGVTNLHVKGHTVGQDLMWVTVYCDHFETTSARELEPDQQSLVFPIRFATHDLQDEVDQATVVVTVVNRNKDVVAKHTTYFYIP